MSSLTGSSLLPGLLQGAGDGAAKKPLALEPIVWAGEEARHRKDQAGKGGSSGPAGAVLSSERASPYSCTLLLGQVPLPSSVPCSKLQPQGPHGDSSPVPKGTVTRCSSAPMAWQPAREDTLLLVQQQRCHAFPLL